MRIVEVAVAIPIVFFILALAYGEIREAWGSEDEERWPQF